MENTRTANQRIGSILTTVGIQPGEGIAIGLLFGQSFLLGIAFFALYTAGTAIFLSHFEASVVAYALVIAAVLLILFGVSFNRLLRQIPFALLLLGSMGGLLLVLLLLRIGLWATSSSPWVSWVAFLLMVMLRPCWIVMNLVLWSLAGRLFNVRQSKRLFPLIVVGMVLAIMVGGLSNQPLINLMGIPNLLWISVVGIGGATGLLFITLRIFHESVGSPDVTNPLSRSGTGFATSAASRNSAVARKNRTATSWLAAFAPYRDRYILWMIAFCLLANVASYLLGFIFIGEATNYFQDTGAYAYFFGTYLGLSTLILFIVSLLGGTILERLGLKFGLQSNGAAVALFALLVLGSSLLFGSGSLLFWLVVLTKLSDDVLIVSMTETAQRILFQPLPAASRVSIQTVMESIVVPVAIGAVGLFLIALQFVGELSTHQLFSILIVISVGWIFSGVKVHDAYRGALRKALVKRRFVTMEPDQSSAERTQVLHEGVRSEHPGVVLYSLELLMEDESAPELLPELLTHPVTEVRLNIAQRIERLEWSARTDKFTPPESWLPLIQERLATDSANREPDAQVRAALCRALIALAEESGDADALGEASAYLHDSDAVLRNAALVGLLRHGGIQSVLTAGPALLALANSTIKEERKLAAQLVGDIGESKFYQPLIPLLRDDEYSVRNAAIKASGAVGNATLWPLIIQGLAHESTRRNAIRSLALGGEAILPILSEQFVPPDQPDVVQTALVRVVSQIGSSEAGDRLWKWSTQAENARGVQSAIWRGLRRNGYVISADKEAVVRSQIAHELALTSWLGRAWEVVNQAVVETGSQTAPLEEAQAKATPVTPESLLAAAIVNELGQARSNLFNLLTLICDRSLIMQVQRILDRHPFSLPDDATAHYLYQGQHQGQNQSQLGDDEQRSYAQEVLDDLLPPEPKRWLLPILSNEFDASTRQAMREVYSVPISDMASDSTLNSEYSHWLRTLINASDIQVIPWTKACANYAANRV